MSDPSPNDPKPSDNPWAMSAVISSWNKIEDVRKNLDAIRKQTVPFDEVVLVDNASSDGTAEMVRKEYPEVKLVVMPHSKYGACETFNLGFSTAQYPLIAILDDDVVLEPDWVEKIVAKFKTEPETTAILSTKVVEPEMPDWYKDHPEVNRERYMATFRGCGSVGRREVLEKAGYYDEKFFIYGNERDLTSRILNLGYRVKQYPEVVTFHGTPFGMKMGKRSLYFHVRNLWWYLFKYVAFTDIVKFWFRMVFGGLAKNKKKSDERADGVGSIGAAKNVFGTKGGVWIVFKATFHAFLGLGHCLKQRHVCRAEDFTLPDH